jgi:hypothetical protein
MSNAISEFSLHIGELRADFKFVSLASQIRPRLGEILQWTSPPTYGLDLATEFMSVKDSRTEGIYGTFLVRLLATLERYVRQLLFQSVELRTTRVKTADQLPNTLVQSNVMLTGRILANVNSLPDHLDLDVEALISNLASCKRGNQPFRLNGLAFSHTVTAVTPEVLQRSLRYIDIDNWWDGVGRNSKLADFLQTEGPRATAKRSIERLKELCKWRNQLAHGGDAQVALTESELGDAINFVHFLGIALDEEISSQLSKQLK